MGWKLSECIRRNSAHIGVRIVFRLMFRLEPVPKNRHDHVVYSPFITERQHARYHSRLRIGKRPALTLDPSEKPVGGPQLLDSRSFNFSKGTNEFGRCQDANTTIAAKI